MIIPHLIFAHLLADYPLQTNWLAARKSRMLDGLLLHGLIVLAITLLMLIPHFKQIFLPVVIFTLIHTTQDWLKIHSQSYLNIHPAWGYFADQLFHYVLIVVLYLAVRNRIKPEPDDHEIFAMSLGACLIAVTRFYDVTWWANRGDMKAYMNRWEVWGYVERIGMLLMSAAGFFFVAPLLALPRLYYAWQKKQPLWQQRYGMVEWSLGIIMSVTLGYVVLYPLLTN